MQIEIGNFEFYWIKYNKLESMGINKKFMLWYTNVNDYRTTNYSSSIRTGGRSKSKSIFWDIR
jgi:hypothetical protein